MANKVPSTVPPIDPTTGLFNREWLRFFTAVNGQGVIDTSGFATTEANNFTGNQDITGSESVSGSMSVGQGLYVGGSISGGLGGWQSWTPTVQGASPMTASVAGVFSAEYLSLGPLTLYSISMTVLLGGSPSTTFFISTPFRLKGDYMNATCYLAGPATPYSNRSNGVAYMDADSQWIQVSMPNSPNFALSGVTVFIAGICRTA